MRQIMNGRYALTVVAGLALTATAGLQANAGDQDAQLKKKFQAQAEATCLSEAKVQAPGLDMRAMCGCMAKTAVETKPIEALLKGLPQKEVEGLAEVCAAKHPLVAPK